MSSPHDAADGPRSGVRPEPSDDTPADVEVFDVGLAHDPRAVAGRDGRASVGSGSGGRRSNRRLALGLVAALGIGAVAIAVDPLGDDASDDGRATEATTFAGVPPPPTLEPLPPATQAPPATEPPPSTLVRNEDLLPAADVLDTALKGADLFAAIRTSRLDRPLRTTTLVTIGQRGFDQTVELTSDPATGRIRVEITAGSNERIGVIDPSRNEGYVLIAPGAWSSYPLGGDDSARWRRLVLGPLDADVLFRAAALDEIRTGPTVSYEPAEGDAVVARSFAVSTTAEFLPGWVPYSLGPQGEAAALDDNAPIDLRVLVDAEDRIREVAWTIPFGNTKQIVTHRLDYPTESAVALPEIASL